MAKKSFLLGLGVGLLIAALTLQLDFWSKEKERAVNASLTIDELRQQAQKFGYELYTKKEIDQMVELKADEKVSAQTAANAASSAAAEPADTKPAATKPAETKPATTKPATTQPAATAIKPAQTTVGPAATETSKVIKIQPGWDATEVANHLVKEGIVKDRQKLVNALIGLSKTRKIAAKSFNLEPDSEPEKVAQIITFSNQ
jgi:hypothetical protein